MVLPTDKSSLLANLSPDDQHFLVVDSHTMGEPTRIILHGFPPILGDTMMEKKHYAATYLDSLRRALILEPRGHAGMFGAVLMEPMQTGLADAGVIFMDSGGYLNMCGHGSIGVATVLVDQKLIPVQEPYTTAVLETPSGLVQTEVKVSDGKAQEVTLTNLPCFLYKENVEISLERFATVFVDVAFGGNFFALVNADALGINLVEGQLPALVQTGMEILAKVNAAVSVSHPYLDITSVDLVEFYGKSLNPKASLKNVVVFGDRQVDRSPCGTGSSAKVAALYKKGKLKLNEEFVYESITGSLFRAKVWKETRVGEFDAVIPKITGSAYITGIHEMILNSNDPFKYGFRLHEI